MNPDELNTPFEVPSGDGEQNSPTFTAKLAGRGTGSNPSVPLYLKAEKGLSLIRILLVVASRLAYERPQKALAPNVGVKCRLENNMMS